MYSLLDTDSPTGKYRVLEYTCNQVRFSNELHCTIHTMSTDLPVELEKRILQRLEDSADRNDIILELCESQGMDWREAEALLDSIHFHHAADITLRQSPLLVALALVFFLGGIGLIAYIAYDLVSFYRMLDEMPSHGSSSGPFGGLLVYLSIVGAQYSGMILLALAMIVGSIKGMENVWEAIFAKLGIFQG